MDFMISWTSYSKQIGLVWDYNGFEWDYHGSISEDFIRLQHIKNKDDSNDFNWGLHWRIQPESDSMDFNDMRCAEEI